MYSYIFYTLHMFLLFIAPCATLLPSLCWESC